MNTISILHAARDICDCEESNYLSIRDVLAVDRRGDCSPHPDACPNKLSAIGAICHVAKVSEVRYLTGEALHAYELFMAQLKRMGLELSYSIDQDEALAAFDAAIEQAQRRVAA